MRNIFRISQVVAVFFFLSATLTAQTDWKGSYSFTEDGGKNAGGSTIVITHELDIFDSAEGLVATLRSNGYQTSSNFISTTKIEGARLLIFFQSYGDDNMFELYDPGDLLITLERKGKAKPVILTHWGKFTPNVTKYMKSGKV